jgi:O-antigen/teichoic acid export membrane protein
MSSPIEIPRKGTPQVERLYAIGKRGIALSGSRNFRKSASNAAYSIAEYIAQPAAMLLAAPFLVHRLGLPQFGIWMLVSAILGSVGILSTGFGDATVKYVSAYRGQNNPRGVERTIRATLTINATLGCFFGLLLWLWAPFLVQSVFKIEPQLKNASIRSIEIAAVILLLRSSESVFVSTLRAFERFGPAVKLNVFLRSVVVVSAVVLAALGHGVVDIMLATLFWSALVVVLQAVAARRVAGPFNVFPTLQPEAVREVANFGCFSWLQALAAVAFNHADRFVVGAMLGTAPVAVYVLCVQATQPIHGLGAAAFNFLFPHLSSRYGAGEIDAPRRVFRLALLSSIALSLTLAAPLILLGKPLLTIWMGVAFARQASLILGILAIAYAILAINVVPHYTLLALGNVRFVSTVNVVAGVVSLCAAVLLIPSFGLAGAAFSRLLYGCVTGLLFVKARNNLLPASATCEATLTAST